MSDIPLEVPGVVPKHENHLDGEIHLPCQGNDTSRKLKREKKEKLDTQDEMSNVSSQPTRKPRLEREPAFVEKRQRKTRLDVSSSDKVERDRSPLRSPNQSHYNLRSKKENVRPNTTPDKNGLARSRGAFRSTASTRRSNRGSTKTARRVSTRGSKRGRAGKTVPTITQITDCQKGDEAVEDVIPPMQQMIGDLENQQLSTSTTTLQQTSTVPTNTQSSSPSLQQTSTPQVVHQETFTPATTPQETFTPQTSIQETFTPPTTLQETFTPPTTLQEVLTPSIAILDKNTPQTILQETFSPPTTLQEVLTPSIAILDKNTPQTILQETFSPPTTLQETFSPPTTLQETFSPPTTLQEVLTPSIAILDKNTPQIILQETFTLQTTHQETFTPQTTFQETFTPSTTLQETFTPPTTLQEILTPQTILQETFTPKTSLKETFTPETILQEIFTPQTILQEILTQQTILQETFTPQASLEETFTSQTNLQKTFTPAKKLQKTHKTDRSNDESCDKKQQLFNANSLNFDWASMSTYTGTKEKFLPQNTGPTRQIKHAYEAFRMFWDDEILDYIAAQTNKYALKLKAVCINFARDWYDTNRHEIMILFAFWIMLGVIRMPTISACYCIHPIIKMDIFRTMMTQSRYKCLNRALFFVDSATRTSNSSKLFYLGPIPEHLNKKFMESYIPDQNITIGESLTSCSGQVSFIQYVNNRPGIKTVELCESKTGYLWSFLINTDKTTTSSTVKVQRNTEIVVDLVKPLLNGGYNLFLDNWYVSPALARYLKQHGTDCVGVVHRSRSDILMSVQNALNSNSEGSCSATHSEGVVAMLYKDKIPVYTISSYYTTDWVSNKDVLGNPTQSEPGLISEYNTNNIDVESKYYTLSPYLKEKNVNTWTLKLFKKLLNASLYNSFILMKESEEEIVCVFKKRLQKTAFELDLVNQILTCHHHLSQGQSFMDPRNFPNIRFFGAHFIVLPPVEEGKRYRTRRFCTWCTFRQGKYSTTAYICDTCHVPLCLKECFKNYHTVQ